jgi:hypothetical protein
MRFCAAAGVSARCAAIAVGKFTAGEGIARATVGRHPLEPLLLMTWKGAVLQTPSAGKTADSNRWRAVRSSW